MSVSGTPHSQASAEPLSSGRQLQTCACLFWLVWCVYSPLICIGIQVKADASPVPEQGRVFLLLLQFTFKRPAIFFQMTSRISTFWDLLTLEII